MEPILLPKADKRYKAGRIVKDKNGRYRGNPETVELKRLTIPANAPIEMRLNPPLMASESMIKFMKDNSGINE